METALLAVQGPAALAILQPLADVPLGEIAYYHFRPGRVAGIEGWLSRTGYTGEDGLEIFAPWDRAGELWDAITAAGQSQGLIPCGLGARDTLRLEAGMRLSGQDIGPDTNPLEAGIGWAVKLDKGDFVGREALARARAEGLGRAFIGLNLEGRAIARHGHRILDEDRPVGEVTSGTYSFTLERAVATGYVEVASKESSALAVEIRGEKVGAHRVALPFYKRDHG